MSRPRKAALPPALENIEKLQKVIEGGNCYGAQQMYKSISARYISAERYSEALDILESGACLQLKHDQVGDDDDMQKLTEELAAAKIRVEGCSSFLKASLRWSIEFGSQKSGSPELHAMLGEYIYSESLEVDMSKVSFHFVRANNPNKFASILVNFLEKCYPGEDDLAIARAVLMYLALGNLRDANYIMDEVKQKVESKELEFPKSELMELIAYLLQTLERDALPLFRMLRQNYQPSIDRDPTFNELLDEIAERFYGVRRKNPMQGMFGDIFKMMGDMPM
ncbi:hypothetical protein KSS87_007482 [Heliosperma pusillum]|nr:hypothetical protein KSS87_007482 [Heliosperma pusillum]